MNYCSFGNFIIEVLFLLLCFVFIIFTILELSKASPPKTQKSTDVISFSYYWEKIMANNMTITWLIWPFYSENNPTINQCLENIVYNFFTDSHLELYVNCIILFITFLYEWRKQMCSIIRNFHFINFKNRINKKHNQQET